MRAAYPRAAAAYAAGIAALVAGSLAAPAGPPGIRDVLLYGRGGAVVVFVLWTFGLTALGFAAWQLRRERRAAPLAAGAVLVGTTLALLVPHLPSSDVVAYRFYGETLLRGGNAYAPAALTGAAAGLPATAAMTALYGNPPVGSAYGPSFLAVAAALAALVPSGTPLPLGALVYRLVALAAFAATTFLVPPSRRAFWALNPFSLFEFALGGHNDALMLLALAVAVRARTGVIGGAAIAVATGIKATALAAAFPLARTRGYALVLAVAGAGALALVAPGFWRPLFVQGVHLGPLWTAVRLALGAIVAALVVLRTHERRDRALAIAIVVVALVPVTHPWYGTWIAFAACWATRGGVRRALALQALLWPLALLDWY